MKRVLSFILTFTLAATSLLLPVQVQAQTQSCEISYTGENLYSEAYKLAELTNALREENGLDSLVLDDALMEYAMKRAQEAAVYYGHTLLDGSPNNFAENLTGATDATEAFRLFSGSPGHRANILLATAKGMGIGCFKINGNPYFIQVFDQRETMPGDEDSGAKSDVAATANIQIAPSFLQPYLIEKKKMILF